MTKKEARLIEMFAEVVVTYLASDRTTTEGSAVLGFACAKVFKESEYAEEFEEAISTAMEAKAVELLGKVVEELVVR